MGFFISYYILKFSKDNVRNNRDSNDSRPNSLELSHVPNLVYMQNQKALTKFIHSELKDRADKKKLLILQT